MEKKLPTPELPAVVKRIREAYGLTQEELAARLGYQKQVVQRMENAGSTLREDFVKFVRLLPYCITLDLIEVQPLRYPSNDDSERIHRADKESAVSPGQRGTEQRRKTRS